MGEVKVFDADTLKERAGAMWANRPALSLAFSPDGKQLATGSPGGQALQIFDVQSGKRLPAVPNAISVRYLAYSPDGRTLATGHGQGAPQGDGGIQRGDQFVGAGEIEGHGTARVRKWGHFSRPGRGGWRAVRDEGVQPLSRRERGWGEGRRGRGAAAPRREPCSPSSAFDPFFRLRGERERGVRCAHDARCGLHGSYAWRTLRLTRGWLAPSRRERGG